MAGETNREKVSASGASLHDDVITAIQRAKNPAIDPLKDPKTVEPIGQIAQIMAHDNYDRDNRLTGKASDTTHVHGWKRIDRVQKDNGPVDSLSMSLWKKGDAVVATVLSVAGPGEAVRNKLGPQPESYAQGKAQIAQWKEQYPGLVLAGHGDRGSTIALQEAKAQNLPAIAFAPDPGKLKLSGNEPIVSFDMSASAVPRGKSFQQDNGIVTRVLDGTNAAGTGRQVASNFLDRIDMRGYNAAFGIGRLQADPSRQEQVRDVTEAKQPFGVRVFNNPLRTLGGISSDASADYRLDQLNQAIKAAEKGTQPLPSMMPAPSSPQRKPSSGLDNVPGIKPAFSESAQGFAQPAPAAAEQEIAITQRNNPAPGQGR